jgi:hypothetical protein
MSTRKKRISHLSATESVTLSGVNDIYRKKHNRVSKEASISIKEDASLSIKKDTSSRARARQGDGYSSRGYGRPLTGGELQSMFMRFSLPDYFQLIDADLPRNALVIAQLLHRQADMRRWPVVKLPTALFNRCGFGRRTVSLALRQLEQKGLVRVHRKLGARSTVTVLWHDINALCSADELTEEEIS